MILREIVTKLGFSIDHQKIKEFDRAIDKVKANLSGLSAAANLAKKAMFGIVAATTGLSLLSLHTAKGAKETELLAQRLGVTVEELQEVELAAQSTGLGVNELSDSMSAFHKKLGDVGRGNTEASREMARLGVVFTGSNGKIKSSFQLFQEFAQKIDKIQNPIAKTAALQRVLGTENTQIIELFKNGGEAIRQQREEIQKIAYVIDSKGISASKEFLKNWADFQIIISAVKKELSVKFMPAFNGLIKIFKEWFILNREIISQNISSFVNITAKAFELLFRAISFILTPITKLISVMGGLEKVITVLGIALSIYFLPQIYSAISATIAWTAALLANPVTWVTASVLALVAAIALLIEDLWSWGHGHKSVIGYILKEWFGFEGTFKSIVDNVTSYFTKKFTELGEWFSDFWSGIYNPVSNVFSKLSSEQDEARQKKALRDGNQGKIQKITPRFAKFTGGDAPPAVIELGDKIKGFNKDIIEPLAINLKPKFEDFAKNNNSPVLLNLNSPSSSIVPNNTYNNTDKKVTQYITENININVPQGTSAEQSRSIATQVAQEMQLQFNANMQRGLDALSAR
jgi:hypothetical protein